MYIYTHTHINRPLKKKTYYVCSFSMKPQFVWKSEGKAMKVIDINQCSEFQRMNRIWDKVGCGNRVCSGQRK